MNIKALIRTIPDWPNPPVRFRDVSSLLRHPEGFRAAMDALIAKYGNRPINAVAGLDARGFLRIVDRKKDMLISGGFNVYPKEVEQCLFQHPHVRDACVIGVPDEKWGEAVKAIVVTDGEVQPAELMAWVKERKGAVMAPKTVEIVDAVPLTAVGKHDKPALRRQYAEG